MSGHNNKRMRHAGDSSTAGSPFHQPHNNYRRKPLAPVNPAKDAIVFQQIEIDSFYDMSSKFLSASKKIQCNQRSGIIRMYGVTQEGNSVCAYVHGFRPYFFLPCWEGFTNNDLTAFGKELNNQLRNRAQGLNKSLTDFVLSIEIVKKQSVWGYHFGKLKHFMQIYLAVPNLIPGARRLCEKGEIVVNGARRSFTTFESNFPYELRFKVDKQIQGASWVEVPAGSYAVRSGDRKLSRCQLEIDLTHDNIIAHQPEGEWQKIAPLRILSFDIECAGRKGIFPTPDQDPVIQIANVMQVEGEQKFSFKNVFTLNTCAFIPGSEVRQHQTERDLLSKWAEFIRECDPDIITGYNIINFDLPYVLERAAVLKINDFPYLGRLRQSRTKIRSKTFSSKAYGTRENKEMNIEGRVQFDVLAIIRKDVKLSSYTLNSVSAHFLGQQKEDVHHSIISDLQNGTDETRRRLAVYCIKDAALPLQLIRKLMLTVNYVEMARVTGVSLNYILTRGQQIKVLSQLYRKAKTKNLLIPVQEKIVTDEKYEGATVIEPKRGYYKDPVTTLDFASLYPSIMMAHNLCYTTLLSPADAKKLPPDSYAKTPNGDYFVKESCQEGLLPLILKELLGARKNAKRLMKAATDPFTKAVLNGRQLALKVSANSVYGFTGATVGQLPCLSISSSVTSYGRDMIHHTKKTVEEHYCIKNGYAHDAEVVYGDTDSVMIKFGVDTVAESIELGKEAAVLVTDTFIKPIKLEFEKVYFPYLLMAKKRYAGMYWTNADHYDKLDAKGIETVRRDNCGLVRMVIQTCLEKMLMDMDVDGAILYAQKQISKLLTNQLDLSLLVITKSLSKMVGMKDYLAKSAHAELAERMRLRDEASAPVLGDRVAYVITRKGKHAKTYQKSEDPVFVLENNIPIDTDYYMHNQLENPLTRIFSPILGDVTVLFEGDHTRHVAQAKGQTKKKGGIFAFAKKVRTCIGCKVVLKGKTGFLCDHCSHNEAQIYLKKLQKARTYEKKFAKLWTECQQCQGSLHEEILCTSRDCPIFYRRIKVRKDLKVMQDVLKKFDF